MSETQEQRQFDDDQRTKEVGYIAAPQPVSGDAPERPYENLCEALSDKSWLAAPNPAPSPTTSVSTAGISHSEPCAECGRNITWHTLSPIWNLVMRRDGQPEPLLCPICFAIRAETYGIESWQLIPDPILYAELLEECHAYNKEASHQSPASAASADENAECREAQQGSTRSQQTATEREKDSSETLTAAPSVAGTQPTPEEREETYYCPICRAEMYALPATIHCPICEAAPAQGTPEPPKVEELARLMYEANGSPSGPWEMFDKERRGYAKAGWLLNANVAIESLRPYFPPASQTPSGPLFAPKPNCPDCRGEGWKDRKDEEYCDPCHCLQVAVLGGRRVTSFLPRNADQAQWQAEVIDLHGKFPKITLSKKMVVGHRPEEGFHVEFVCLDREDVIHLAAMLHFYNESFKQPLAIPASTARTDGWVSVRDRLPATCGIYEVIIAHAGKEEYRDGAVYDPTLEEEWTFSSDPHHGMIDLEVSRWREFGPLPAAPGSVPQAPELEPIDYAKWSREWFEFRKLTPQDFYVPDMLKDFHAALEGGVPQAEPPKCSMCRGVKKPGRATRGRATKGETLRLNFSNHRILDITECEWKDLCILLLGSSERVTVPPAGLTYGCVHICDTPASLPSAEEYDQQWKEAKERPTGDAHREGRK